MTPGEETHSSAIPKTRGSTVRIRMGDIGEVIGVGQCWRLAYDRCDHVQQFAQEGLEDPVRLLLFVRRNFPECLSCRIEMPPQLKASRAPLADSALVTQLLDQPPDG